MTDPLSTIVEREVTEALEFFDLPELLALVIELANGPEPVAQTGDPGFAETHDCTLCDANDVAGPLVHQDGCPWIRAKRWVDTNLTKAQNELNRD